MNRERVNGPIQRGWRRLLSGTVITLTALGLGVGIIEAQGAAEEPKQESPAPDDENVHEGYGDDEGDRHVGGPTDVNADLDNSFPQPDSVFPSLIPGGWFDLKENLYDRTGLKIGFSYQSLFQVASDTVGNDDTAWSGWALLEGKWTPLRRGKDYEGSLAFALDYRHTMGNHSNPAAFGTQDVGSLWPTNIEFFEFDAALAVLYWEQWFTKNRFVLRVGKQIAAQTFDFFRFKDARTSFTASPFAVHTSIPAPGPAQGISFQLWPHEDSELYVSGTLNDMNGDPEDFGVNTVTDERQYFYGLEVGYFWRRSKADFDHVHLDVFYADEKDTQAPFLPNESGGGFKVLGSKQKGRLVGFGSYTYNTAEGGGFGLTFGEHTVTAGLALLKPWGIKGEIGFGTTWMEPINDGLRDQYGGELYWKLLLTPDLWLTPGFQFIIDPSLNTQEDFVTIGQLKFRLFL